MISGNSDAKVSRWLRLCGCDEMFFIVDSDFTFDSPTLIALWLVAHTVAGDGMSLERPLKLIKIKSIQR